MISTSSSILTLSIGIWLMKTASGTCSCRGSGIFSAIACRIQVLRGSRTGWACRRMSRAQLDLNGAEANRLFALG